MIGQYRKLTSHGSHFSRGHPDHRSLNGLQNSYVSDRIGRAEVIALGALSRNGLFSWALKPMGLEAWVCVCMCHASIGLQEKSLPAPSRCRVLWIQPGTHPLQFRCSSPKKKGNSGYRVEAWRPWDENELRPAGARHAPWLRLFCKKW